MSNEVTFVRNLDGVVFAYTGRQLFRITNARIELVATLGVEDYVRPQSTLWKNYLFLTSPDFRPIVIDRGGLVKQFNNAPLCRLSTIYRDHLICGDIIEHHGVSSASRVLMSDLRKFNIWTPRSDNEAAEYDLDSYTSARTGVTGVTGLKQFGPDLLIYTPRSIEIMRYTGLERGVYNKDLLYSELGSVFKFGVVGNNRIHFFISEDNIFQLDANGLQTIGDPILEYIEETATTNATLLQRTWGYYDATEGEVVWCYYGRDSDKCDRAIMYNIYEQRWYADRIEDIHSFDAAKINDKFTAFDDLQVTFDELSGSFDGLSAPDTVFSQRLFGSSERNLYTDARPSDTLVEKAEPFIETRDEHFNDLDKVKEINSVRLQTAYGDDCLGVDVYVSVRTFIEESVEFEHVGLWTNDIRHKRLTFPIRSGVIFRFKFVPKPVDPQVGVRNVKISGWSYGINSKNSNRGNSGVR